MNMVPEHLNGLHVVLTEGARWRNYGEAEARHLHPGAVVRLESWRPEGYMATVIETGETFFVSSRFLQAAEAVKEGEETIIRKLTGPAVYCDSCGEECGQWQSRWHHVNRAMEGETLCPDCAAVLLAESSSLNFTNLDDPAGVLVDYFSN